MRSRSIDENLPIHSQLLGKLHITLDMATKINIYNKQPSGLIFHQNALKSSMIRISNRRTYSRSTKVMLKRVNHLRISTEIIIIIIAMEKLKQFLAQL